MSHDSKYERWYTNVRAFMVMKKLGFKIRCNIKGWTHLGCLKEIFQGQYKFST